MVDLTKKYDVLVIGGGNAALCAAISARRDGASVLVLETATEFNRGGNTRHTRNMRCAHDAATDTLTGPYPEEELFDEHWGLQECVHLLRRFGQVLVEGSQESGVECVAAEVTQ